MIDGPDFDEMLRLERAHPADGTAPTQREENKLTVPDLKSKRVDLENSPEACRGERDHGKIVHQMPTVTSTLWRCAKGHTIMLHGPPDKGPSEPPTIAVKIADQADSRPLFLRSSLTRPICPVCFLLWAEDHFPIQFVEQTTSTPSDAVPLVAVKIFDEN